MGKIKRYVIFAYDDFYPCGGFEDFKSSFDTIEEAMIFR